eukprot:TRINITY_DN12196_c0_g1_i1.p1 TRINITY_DN12196_c0_g1~~TRINITY_DN12196_c0_g1_i1.p1  ORF type:complete len:337 (-),score=2.61 TRINITY_DN12196_c0_g1_i1:11-1021(-)
MVHHRHINMYAPFTCSNCELTKDETYFPSNHGNPPMCSICVGDRPHYSNEIVSELELTQFLNEFQSFLQHSVPNQKNKHMSVFIEVIQERIELWRNHPDKDEFQLSFEDRLFPTLKFGVVTVSRERGLTSFFMLNVIIECTRYLEAFGVNEQGGPLFPSVSKEEFERCCHADPLHIYHLAADQTIQTLTKSKLLSSAKAKLKANLETLKLITPGITTDILDEFYGEVEVVEYSHMSFIHEFSSYNGSVCFISSRLDPRQTLLALERELVLCLIRWRDAKGNQLNPRLITPLRNPNLRTDDGRMVEANDFYEGLVYHKDLSWAIPFNVSRDVRKLTL